jgi:hypothetical protein
MTVQKHTAPSARVGMAMFVKDVCLLVETDTQMKEAIKRYEQAKKDGTLDIHFPSL